MGSASLAAKTTLAGLSSHTGCLAIACAQDNEWHSGCGALFGQHLQLSMGSQSAQIPGPFWLAQQ
jgi:hypothetical protein